MQIACDDIAINVIEKLIAEKEKMLRETYIDLKKTAAENAIFKVVLGDYEKYYNNIIIKKQKQYDAFKVISDYLDNLIMNTDILNDEAKQMKEDQKEILKKLSHIRGELDELMI